MKIDPGKINQLLNKYDNNSKQKKVNDNSKDKSDKLNLSDKAKGIQKGRAVYGKLPNVRAEKVAQLKEEIKTGNYNVSGEEIAGAMLDSVINQKV